MYLRAQLIGSQWDKASLYKTLAQTKVLEVRREVILKWLQHFVAYSLPELYGNAVSQASPPNDEDPGDNDGEAHGVHPAFHQAVKVLGKEDKERAEEIERQIAREQEGYSTTHTQAKATVEPGEEDEAFGSTSSLMAANDDCVGQDTLLQAGARNLLRGTNDPINGRPHLAGIERGSR